jgi:hypothetical protein
MLRGLVVFVAEEGYNSDVNGADMDIQNKIKNSRIHDILSIVDAYLKLYIHNP